MGIKNEISRQIHSIPPVWNEHSRILILGSFPSVKSRETEFFYGHPQNRFWRVLAEVFDRPLPITVEEKKIFLLENNIALWDVISSCELLGSSDSSIRNVKPNDITEILAQSNATAIFLNGATAARLYDKYIFPTVNIKGIPLPSTSPANATWSFERLCDAWRIVRLQDQGGRNV